MNKFSYKELLNKHIKILRSLKARSGLFYASNPDSKTGYDKSWIRDNFYETLAFEILGDWKTVERTYKAILTIFLKYEEKIDWAIANKPKYSYQYIHARFHPETFTEFWEEWGNKQNDAIGAILYRIGELEINQKRSIIKTSDQERIVNKLIKYLASIEYWHDKDSGMWEEDEEIHASSIGACVAGLKSVSRLSFAQVPISLIKKGEDSLRKILPRESERKFVDLAQLSLIWPYNVVNESEREIILENILYHLKKERGIIRYKGDRYYNKNKDQFSEEAEWTFGLAWLSIIYEKMGYYDKAKELINDLIAIDTPKGLPELYLSNSIFYNENTPLGWSESLFIVSLFEMNTRY